MCHTEHFSWKFKQPPACVACSPENSGVTRLGTQKVGLFWRQALDLRACYWVLRYLPNRDLGLFRLTNASSHHMFLKPFGTLGEWCWTRAKTAAWITLPRGTAAGAAAGTADRLSWTSLTRPAGKQSETFLSGSGNGWLKYCAIVHFIFWCWQQIILRVILET